MQYISIQHSRHQSNSFRSAVMPILRAFISVLHVGSHLVATFLMEPPIKLLLNVSFVRHIRTNLVSLISKTLLCWHASKVDMGPRSLNKIACDEDSACVLHVIHVLGWKGPMNSCSLINRCEKAWRAQIREVHSAFDDMHTGATFSLWQMYLQPARLLQNIINDYDSPLRPANVCKLLVFPPLWPSAKS